MFAACASACSASVSTFAKTMSELASEAFSNVGANCRHGPHHAAQKSTRTMSLSATVFSNCAAVSSIVLMCRFLQVVDDRRPQRAPNGCVLYPLQRPGTSHHSAPGTTYRDRNSQV